MDGVREQIAYLQGLAEGTELDEAGMEGRMLLGVLDILEEMARQVDDLSDDVEDLEIYVEEVDEALWVLEDRYNGQPIPVDDDYVDPDMIEWELTCPSCGERVYYVKEDDAEVVEVLCPVCGEVLWTVDNGFSTTEETAVDDDWSTEDLTKRKAPNRND